jgi:hypothetical protein
MSASVQDIENSETAPRTSYYRISALASGCARMRNAWKVVLPILLANAVLQALLILPTAEGGLSVWFLVTVVASAVVLLVAALVVQAASIAGAVAPTDWPVVAARIRATGARFVLVIVLLAVAVVIGLAFNLWVGLLIAGLFCFLSLAAVDGEANPVAANFRTIRVRPIRWLVTLTVMAVIAGVLWFLMAVNWFFIPTPVGAFIATFVGGLVTWWWSNTLALIYLSARTSWTQRETSNDR